MRNDEQVEMPNDLAEALQARPDAEAIWNRLPEAHRSGHVIAIQRITDPKKRTERIHQTIEHLVEHHGS